MDAILEAKQKLAAAVRKRAVLDADRMRLRKEIGVENLSAARALLHELNGEVEALRKRRRILLRKIEKALGIDAE